MATATASLRPKPRPTAVIPMMPTIKTATTTTNITMIATDTVAMEVKGTTTRRKYTEQRTALDTKN